MVEANSENLSLERWRGGDRAAGDELMQLCKPMLRWFFRRRTADNVEELAQGTLVGACRPSSISEGRSSFKTFLLGIAHKQFLMSLRANRPRELPAAMQHPRSEPEPDSLSASKEEVRSVSDALNHTSPAFRQVLEMFYWEELSVDEIARTLDVRPGHGEEPALQGAFDAEGENRRSGP